MVHYDGIENGEPSGDRGLVLMENMHSVEKVLGVDTFVLKGDNKVYLLKMSRTTRPSAHGSRRCPSSSSDQRGHEHLGGLKGGVGWGWVGGGGDTVPRGAAHAMVRSGSHPRSVLRTLYSVVTW